MTLSLCAQRCYKRQNMYVTLLNMQTPIPAEIPFRILYSYLVTVSPRGMQCHGLL